MKKSQPTIPPKEIPFTFESKGATYGREYKGDFVVKVPSGKDLSKVGLELAKLNQGVPQEHLDHTTANLHNSIAFLKVCLIEVPEWLVAMEYGLESEDYNIPVEIALLADSKVVEWKKAVRGES